MTNGELLHMGLLRLKFLGEIQVRLITSQLPSRHEKMQLLAKQQQHTLALTLPSPKVPVFHGNPIDLQVYATCPCSFYTQSNDSAQHFAQHLKMPQNCEYNCFRRKVITGSDFAPIEIGFTFL